ncbi:MAG: hypothetical protein QXS57_02985 [Candidatus Caldarchaeum sp.]
MSYETRVMAEGSGLSRVAKLLIDSKLESVEPTLDETGYRYIFIEKKLNVDSSQAVRILEQLSEKGVLDKQLIESVMSCPDCNNIYLSLKPACPTCGSGRLLRGNVVEHLVCGHVDFEQEFYKKGFECPKCKKQLQALGVDYRRAGVFYKCLACGRVSGITVKRYVCSKCFRASAEEELTLTGVYKYVVLPDKLSKFYGAFIDLSPLTSYFGSKQIHIASPATLAGLSGILHDFTLYVNKFKEDPSAGVVADIVSEADESKIYELFTKSFDVKAGSTLLLATGQVDEKLLRLAKTFNIEVITSDSAENLLEKSKTVMENHLNRLSKKRVVKELQDLENLLKKL